VTSWLVKHAPKPFDRTRSSDQFLAVIHHANIDPNLAFLAVRNPEELKAKSVGFPGVFTKKRQVALEKYAASAPVELEAFYNDKLHSNGFLATLYSSGVTEAHQNVWFKKSNDSWDAVKSFILNKLPSYIPNGAFISGLSAPGEEDLHLAAWLARITLVTGGDKSASGVHALEGELGQPVPPELQTYWAKWSSRESWKKVYGDGLH